jgi:hypothetical protein
MASFETTLFIPVAPEDTFRYVSDFRHATWDPRVSRATRTDGNGPLGLGATFLLVSPLPVGSIRFPYRITSFEAPHRVVLEGETWFARYRDELTLTPAAGGTSLRYAARFRLRGLLRLGEPLMQLLFQRIGRDATVRIPEQVAANASVVRS